MADLDEYERAVLWNAVEGTYLIEFRNGDSSLPSEDVPTYRQRVGSALVRLVDRGLAHVVLVPWDEPGASGQPLTASEVAARLEDRTAWDPDQAILMRVEVTVAGRAAVAGGQRQDNSAR